MAYVMPFAFSDKVAALADLISLRDPAAARLAVELLADSNEHLEAVAGLVRIDLQARNYPSALLHAGRLIRMNPKRLDFIALNAAVALSAGRYREVGSIAANATENLGLDATILEIALRAALALGDGDDLLAFARSLAALGAMSTTVIDLLDAVVLTVRGVEGWVASAGEHGLIGGFRRDALQAATIRYRRAGTDSIVVDLADFAVVDEAGPLLRFHVPRERSAQGGVATFRGRTSEFIGSSLRLPASPKVLGAVWEEHGTISGWAWAPGLPDTALKVIVRDRLGREITLIADAPSRVARKLGCPTLDCGFTLNTASAELAPGRIVVEALAVPLAGSPVEAPDHGALVGAIAMWRRAAPRPPAAPADEAPVRDALARVPIKVGSQASRQRRSADAGRPRGVIVPVYDGRTETLACLASVLATVPAGTRIVVVDDAAPDPDLSDDLLRLSREGAITLLRNSVNLGYPGAVNRGLAEAAGRDVVLLNADTLVAGDWLDRMARACHSAEDIGTVTALAASGSIASYGGGVRERSLQEVEAIDWSAQRVNAGETAEVPTGVGHCLYVRAECLAEVGSFDAVTFGRGYGEENDFCLRARALGWRHVVAADVFIGHSGERSFGAQRRILADRNGAIIEQLYPGYNEAVARHVAADPLAPARRRIDRERLRLDTAAPATLIITMGWTGGVATHVTARVEELREGGQRPVTLQAVPPAPNEERRRSRLVVAHQPDLEDLVFERDEFDDLLVLLKSLRIGEIEFHHTLHHDPRVLELPAMLGVPYAIVVHDYSWICPRMSLVGGEGRYCGEPDAAECDRCVASFGASTDEAIPVADLRARSRRIFEGAARVTAPSRDVAARLKRYVAGPPMEITPWDAARPTARHIPGTGSLTVAVPGAIGLHKGFAVLKACAEDAVLRDLPLRFVVVGYSEDDYALFSTGRIFVTGHYEVEEFPTLLSLSGAEVALLPSVCPETWSYTLSEVWRSGLEVLAFDIGAIAERIGEHGGGRLLPMSATPAAVNDALLAWKRPSNPRIVEAKDAFGNATVSLSL
ncbi:glycosyltransferase [Jiella sp. M17.18]|uniref:glycosyltransferase n=1 Tax=Jiella sp. M17.18 TaxID=3234247 RepID=UPI0034DE0F14